MRTVHVLPLLLMVCAATVSAQIPRRPAPPSATFTGVAVPRLKIGLDANPKTTSDYQQDAFKESIALMKTTGATQFHYAQQWSTLEVNPGIFNTSQLEFMVGQVRPTPITFTLKIIDAGGRTMPDAYKGLAWDSPEMVARLTRLIERIAPVLGALPCSYAIGNEIDMYFANRPGEIAAYGRLLQMVKATVRRLHPAASFTTSFQFGAVGQIRSVYAPIVAALDHVAFTYYPIRGDFSVRGPAAIATDLPRMIAAAQPLPVTLHEFGYPTSSVLGSSNDQQAEFMRRTFEAIRAADAGRVLGVTYLFQADLPEWLVNLLVGAYHLDSENFRAYLRTLGLRDERDRPKPAWDEFIRQVDAFRPMPRQG